MKKKLAWAVSGLFGLTALAATPPLVYAQEATTETMNPAAATKQMVQDLKEPATAAQAKAQEIGGVSAGTETTFTATIKSLDKETRQVTVTSADGEDITVPLGEGARNLDQIEIGDRVQITYSDALLLNLVRGQNTDPTGVVSMGAFRAESGQKPAVGVGRTLNVVAIVEAINADKRTITLKGPEETVTLAAPEHINLSEIQVGDEVTARYRQKVSIVVESDPATQRE
jgi:Cu/Ag efflux protein CusF